MTAIPMIFFIKRPKAPFGQLLQYSLIMFALQFVCLITGIHWGMTPALASLLTQTQVFFTLFLSLWIFKISIAKWSWFGALVAFLGILIVATHTGGSFTLHGMLAVILSALLWAYGNILSKKFINVDPTSLIIWSSFLATPFLLALSLIVEGPTILASTILSFSWREFLSIGYVSYFSTLFSFVTWNKLIQQFPLSKIVPTTMLIPIIAQIGSTLAFDEPIQNWKILAGLFVFSGLLINFVGPLFFSEQKEKEKNLEENLLRIPIESEVSQLKSNEKD